MNKLNLNPSMLGQEKPFELFTATAYTGRKLRKIGNEVLREKSFKEEELQNVVQEALSCYEQNPDKYKQSSLDQAVNSLALRAALRYTTPILQGIGSKYDHFLETDAKLREFMSTDAFFATVAKNALDTIDRIRISPYERSLREEFAPHIRQAIEPIYQQRANSSWLALFNYFFTSISG